jgi:hypothetical protein
MNETHLLLAHTAATLFMVGLIWFVQIVHYPLFASVDRSQFPAYEKRHTTLTTWVVVPPMMIEAITAGLLFIFSPAGITSWQLVIGLTLLFIIWLSTALIQIPCHTRLSEKFDDATHRKLVLSNWIRTAAWSFRGLLVLWMVNSHR